MADKTGIAWTRAADGTKGATWNPVVGCSKISAGCANCYAETVDKRFAAQWGREYMPWTAANAAHNVRLHADRLEQPLRWARPRKIFVNSMSDLFHEQVPDEFIRRVFAVMGEAHWHTFQILTKRPERMKKLLNSFLTEKDFATWTGGTEPPFPWPNIWLGVSVENQQAADERIPLLLQTPAAVRFLSMEPLLGAVDISSFLPHELFVCQKCGEETDGGDLDHTGFHANCGGELDPNGQTDDGVNFVIVGGESGLNARPMHPQWVRTIRDQCVAADTPYFFKQWGEWFPRDEWEHNPELILPDDDVAYTESAHTHVFEGPDGIYPVHRVGKKKAGRLLDGRTWDEMPGV